MLDPAIRNLAQGKNFAALSFHLPNGDIATHIMWVDADDEHILINTEIHRAKYGAIVANPAVTVTIWDHESPYNYAEVRGTYVGDVRGDEARAHVDRLADRYMGTLYQGEVESERVIMKIAPDRQRVKGVH